MQSDNLIFVAVHNENNFIRMNFDLDSYGVTLNFSLRADSVEVQGDTGFVAGRGLRRDLNATFALVSLY